MAKSVIINGVTYPDCPEVNIPLSGGGTAQFYDPSDATATTADVLSGETVYIDGGKATGQMPNNGDTSGTISTKAGTVTIPAGYTSGGTVSLDGVSECVMTNIAYGHTILGVAGHVCVVDTTLLVDQAQANMILQGKKAYQNGQLVTGTLTVPTITQDSTTKVLTIQ